MQKLILHLKLPTDPRWVNIAEKSLEEILTDHAYCEQKAASSCISLIISYPEKEKLVEEITTIVAEEWEHFQRVLQEIKKRNFSFGRMRKDEYVNKLTSHIRKGTGRKNQLTDKLLIAALIEARSCERFKTLSENLEEAALKKFYFELMVSEASHYTTFITLAREYQGREIVDQRWQELLQIEKEIITNLKPRGDRIH